MWGGYQNSDGNWVGGTWVEDGSDPGAGSRGCFSFLVGAALVALLIWGGSKVPGLIRDWNDDRNAVNATPPVEIVVTATVSDGACTFNPVNLSDLHIDDVLVFTADRLDVGLILDTHDGEYQGSSASNAGPDGSRSPFGGFYNSPGPFGGFVAADWAPLVGNPTIGSMEQVREPSGGRSGDINDGNGRAGDFLTTHGVDTPDEPVDDELSRVRVVAWGTYTIACYQTAGDYETEPLGPQTVGELTMKSEPRAGAATK